MFPTRFIRLIAVLVAVVGFTLLASAGPASAGAPAVGICHATGSQTNQFTFIGPDDASFAAHLAHFGPGGGDRFATVEETEEEECQDAPVPTATNVPPTATNVPPTATDVPPTATNVPPTATTAPGEPTATTAPPTATTAPGQPTATSVPVQTLPETGANPSDGNQAGILLIVGTIAVLLFSGATWAASRTRR